jgi:hypothetical protein
MPQFIIENRTRGVFVGWKDSPSTEAAWAMIDGFPDAFQKGTDVLLVPEGPGSGYKTISRPLPPVDVDSEWVKILAPIVVRHRTIGNLLAETNEMIVAAVCWRIRQIHPTAAKVVLAYEDGSFFVHHVDLEDGSTIPGIPDTVEEDDPLEDVQSLVGDLYREGNLAEADTIELDIEENPL